VRGVAWEESGKVAEVERLKSSRVEGLKRRKVANLAGVPLDKSEGVVKTHFFAAVILSTAVASG
jgi:DNA-binding transcriptional regulator YbjK